jgi:hypothetical protein
VNIQEQAAEKEVEALLSGGAVLSELVVFSEDELATQPADA